MDRAMIMNSTAGGNVPHTTINEAQAACARFIYQVAGQPLCHPVLAIAFSMQDRRRRPTGL